jgi:hypothetical protein
MVDEVDNTDDELTQLGRKTVIRTDDDKPPITDIDIEQREDESDDEYLKRKEKESRGTAWDKVYLHENGWVKVVREDITGNRERWRDDEYEKAGGPAFEFWFPPQRIEVIR